MAEILHGVYPEPMAEILHFVQNDRRRVQNDRRRVQNDKHGISLIATHSLTGEGLPCGVEGFTPQGRGEGD
jgi:hypothetical protein